MIFTALFICKCTLHVKEYVGQLLLHVRALLSCSVITINVHNMLMCIIRTNKWWWWWWWYTIVRQINLREWLVACLVRIYWSQHRLINYEKCDPVQLLGAYSVPFCPVLSLFLCLIGWYLALALAVWLRYSLTMLPRARRISHRISCGRHYSECTLQCLSLLLL